MSEPDAIEDAKLLQRAIACFEQFADLDPDARRQHLHDLHSREPALAARVAKLLAADAREHGVLEAGLAALAPAALHQLASGRMEKEAHSANDMIGPWRLKEMLGRGGMGEVWLASRNDGQFEQQVAVKLLKRGMDSDGVLHRFQRERQILARLEHPGIARLLDGGMTAAGLPYFAMECIRGVPIDQFARTHQLDVRSRVRLVIALCSAVDYAHRHLVVHRDLKPANTLVTDEGVLKVLDFGIARVLDESSNVGATETGSRVMSPAYASPEQLLGEPIAIATDVYAIGLLLYELLSGVLPHGRGHQSLSQVVADVSRDATEAPSTLGRMWHRGAEAQGQVLPGIDRELDLIVLQALRSSPEARYPSAAALAEDLCSWLERRPIRARPATLGYRVAKFVARNRLAVVLGGVALAVVLAALSVSIVQRRAAIANAEAARASARRAELSKQFLVSMFDRADAFSTANHGEKTVVELLESTPDRLINELADEPEVQAELLLEIGSGLRVAGRRNSAHAAYRTALDSIARIPAADPILHAKALLYIGYAENDLGKSDDARTHLMQAQAIYRAAADDRRRELISVATGLARNANMRGDLTSALQLREQILSERRALSGERDPDYAMDLMNLSTSLIALGRYADAEQALRRSQALLSELLGARHLRTLTVLHALAAIHLEQGRLDEARTNAELVLERSADNAAAQASLRPAANSVLARVALYEYRLDAAEHHARIALTGEPTMTMRGAAQRNLGRILLERGQTAEAVDALRLSLEAYPGASAMSRHALWAKLLHAEALRRSDPRGNSMEALRATFTALGASEGARGVEQFEAGLLMGAIEREAGSLDRAITLHEEALALARADGVLGEVGLAYANAELALDLRKRGANGDANAAAAAAATSIPFFERSARADPRLAAMESMRPK